MHLLNLKNYRLLASRYFIYMLNIFNYQTAWNPNVINVPVRIRCANEKNLSSLKSQKAPPPPKQRGRVLWVCEMKSSKAFRLKTNNKSFDKPRWIPLPSSTLVEFDREVPSEHPRGFSCTTLQRTLPPCPSWETLCRRQPPLISAYSGLAGRWQLH